MLLQEHIHAEELSEQRLKFFMSMSHEIRTPMTLIVTPLMQLIKEDSDSHRRAIYQIIRRNAERILHLVNQIMDLRKIDKGLMTIHRHEVDLVEFIDDICSTFRAEADAKRIHLEFQHDDAHLPALIDRGNFDKVVVNILSNAFKYTQPEGNILIHLWKDGDDVRISVYDDGEKIPDDKLSHIFERFYQVPGCSNDNTTGTGIGLDLARSIVELHYGSISVKNNPDRGCTFTVAIPQYPELTREEIDLNEKEAENPQEELQELQEEIQNSKCEIQNEATPTSNVPSGNSSKLKVQSSKALIAVVEDDAEIANYLSTQLSKDYDVQTYPNGKEALKGILTTLPALVISDVMMPVMDGNELCAKLKANINTNHIPFIMLTAKASDADRMQGIELGADAYVAKPFNMDVLLSIIHNLIRQRKVLRNKYEGKETAVEQMEMGETVSSDDRMMQRIIKAINDNLQDPDLDVEKIAREAGVSRAKLYRKMKELTNQTPHNYIRNLRLQLAAKLLKEKKLSVSEITYMCGFSSLSSFSAMFKTMYGVSPLNYSSGTKEE